jgi:hypothetical protein
MYFYHTYRPLPGFVHAQTTHLALSGRFQSARMARMACSASLLRDMLPVGIPLLIAWGGWLYQRRRRRIALARALWRDAKPVRLHLPHAQKQGIQSLPHAQFEVWRNYGADVTDLFPAEVVGWLTDAWWNLAQGVQDRHHAAAVERAMCWYINAPLDEDAANVLRDPEMPCFQWNPPFWRAWQRSFRANKHR